MNSATICNKQNQKRPIRTGGTAGQRFATSLRWAMTSREVMGLSPVTKSLVTLYNCFLTVEDNTDTQKKSGTRLPYRRCERRIFVKLLVVIFFYSKILCGLF